jgi:acetyl/propionyl-CoA carboxylase alpha subunit
MRYVTTIGERECLVEILDEHHVSVDGIVYEVDLGAASGQTIYSALINHRSYEAFVYPGEEGWEVILLGSQYVLQVEDEREKRLRASLGRDLAENIDYHLRSPMPGLVVTVPVTEGQTVAKGEVLVVLESMKMQNELKSPRPGTVARLRVKPGDSVELREHLLSVI